MTKVGLCLPLLNAGEFALKMVSALKAQTIAVDRVLVLDSGSTDDSVQHFSQLDAEVHKIERENFDHGATRQKAVELLSDYDIVIFLTQDAIPAGPNCLEQLISCLEKEAAAAAFGRQLPRIGAQPIEAHARLFNYPAESRIKSAEDIPTLGLKTAFISNSFAAYRLDALKEVGGFPRKTIIGEDTYVAGKMLLAGWRIAYCAEAEVSHSHKYSFWQEWQRYFDTGVFHACNPWMRKAFGGAEGEGLRFLKSEIQYVARQTPWLVPSVLLRVPVRYLGFRAGLLEKYLPLQIKRKMSAQKAFWSQTS